MKDGKIIEVSITETADQPLRPQNQFEQNHYHSNLPVKMVENEIQCAMLKGQPLILTLQKILK
jgi:hypothetical protein